MKVPAEAKAIIKELAKDTCMPNDELLALAVYILVIVTETIKVRGQILIKDPAADTTFNLKFDALQTALLTHSDDFLTEK